MCRLSNFSLIEINRRINFVAATHYKSSEKKGDLIAYISKYYGHKIIIKKLGHTY